MKPILKQYQNLLEKIDTWFAQAISRNPGQIACAKGCCDCCRGLFEISMLDAALLNFGFNQLGEPFKKGVRDKAEARLAELQQLWPEFRYPFILNRLPHDDWQEMPEEDMTPCPLLGPDGLCLVYAYRPMTCRLHGLPHIDVSDEMFSEDYCPRNFTHADPFLNHSLRYPFRETFAAEFDLLGDFSQQLQGYRTLELDTFIPCAVLIDFESGN